MYLFFILFYSFWLIVAFVFAFFPKSLGKFRNTLHRYGFFARWSVYVPNKSKENAVYHLQYRDKDSDGEISEWTDFQKQKLGPFRFVFYPHGRLSSVLHKCAIPLIKEKQIKDSDLTRDDRFLYICSIVCSFTPKSIHSCRQIKLEYTDSNGVRLLISTSEFLPIQ